MRKRIGGLALVAGTAVAAGAAVFAGAGSAPSLEAARAPIADALQPAAAQASSHREAPLISNDPTADLTDLYAFPSPDAPDTITVIANAIPIEVPSSGPNYYNLDDSARYRIMVDWNGDGRAERTWILRTKTRTRNEDTFLYTLGQVTSPNDPDLNVVQTWKLYQKDGDGKERLIGNGYTAPNNVGKRSMPNYASPRGKAVHTLKNGMKVYVGPSEDPFSIDIGRIFDLLGVGGPGTDNLAGVNVHSIALQIPVDQIRKSATQPVIGVWSAVDRLGWKQTKKRVDGRWKHGRTRTWKQVQRLGQPLINEVFIPRVKKDYWNSVGPDQDAQFERYYTDQSKPGQFIWGLNQLVLKPLLTATLGSDPGTTGPTGLAQETGRADLSAILLRGFKYPNTGTPALDLTFGKGDRKQPVDELRLNTAVPATPSASVDRRGLLCNFAGAGGPFANATGAACNGQFDAWPNGRRLGDDVNDIAVAAAIGLPIDNLIPTDLQRAYALLALGGSSFPSSSPLSALNQGADGVLANDANGGVFAQEFPYLLPAFPGNG